MQVGNNHASITVWPNIVRQLDNPEPLSGKRRLNFATLITKERLNFPKANHYHVDIIITCKFYDWKTQRSIVANIESRCPTRGI